MKIESLIHGGEQEDGLRAGTENVTAIVGFGKAAELAVQRIPDMQRVHELRDKLKRGIRALLPKAKLNGHPDRRIPNTLNMCLPGLRGEALVMAMDQKGVAFSSGSACRSGSPDPSHVLLAMGLTREDAHCSIRLSLGPGNTEEEIDRTIEMFGKVINEMSSAVRFVPCR
jgi:cysteine sulfinate desulfinase/cysteine desulfurase-like protein